MQVTKAGKARLQSPEFRELMLCMVDEHKSLEIPPEVSVESMLIYVTFILAGFEQIDLSVPLEEVEAFLNENKMTILEPLMDVALALNAGAVN
jgi:hypothetical protein